MRRQTLSSARRNPPKSQNMDDDGETVALGKKEEAKPLSATETFEKDLARIKENGKEIKGTNNRNFYKSIVERIENNVKVLAELRDEHSQLRDRLKELTRARPETKFNLHEEIAKMTKQINNLQRSIDRLKNDKENAIARQQELQLILKNFEQANKGNTPDTYRITTLKNQLDKANIKINETKHLIKMYERVITKFEQQKIHWNPLVKDKWDEIQKQNRDLSEVRLIKGESEYSKNSAKNQYKTEFQRIQKERKIRKEKIEKKKNALKNEMLYHHQDELTPEDSRRVRPQQTLGSQNSALLKSKQNKAQREAKEEKIRSLQAKLDACEEAFGSREPADIDKIIKERENTSKSLNVQIEELKNDIENLQNEADQLKMEIEEQEYTQAQGVGGNRLLVEGNKLQEKKDKELAELKRSIEAFQKYQKNVSSGVMHMTEILSLITQPTEKVPTDLLEILEWVYIKVKAVTEIINEEDGDISMMINKQVLGEMRQQTSLDIDLIDSSKRMPKKTTEGLIFKRQPKDTKNEETSRVLTRQQVKLFAKQQAAAAPPPPPKKLPSLNRRY